MSNTFVTNNNGLTVCNPIASIFLITGNLLIIDIEANPLIPLPLDNLIIKVSN
jgi:hypothetical protein